MIPKFDKEHLVLSEQPYTSIQGEGRNVGCPMTYVRTQGCPVGCVWCDSYYTWLPYNSDKIPSSVMQNETIVVSHAELDRIIMEENCAHVWFTGGEPTIQGDAICKFLELFKYEDKIYHICTAGWVWNTGLYDRLDCITIDVKAPTSKTASNYDVLDRLYTDEEYSYKVEFKMVVANNKKDRDFAREMVSKYLDAEWTLQPLYLGEPAVSDSAAGQRAVDTMVGWTLKEFAEWVNDNFRYTPNVRMGTQLHKHIWPYKKRGI